MDITNALKKLFPEGSVQGQCGVFAHKIIDFPLVGDTYRAKKQAVDYFGVKAANIIEYRIGDVLICSDGTFMGFGAGHVAVVANIVGNNLILVESNYNNDGRVHYGRSIAKTDKRIYGVMRGRFIPELIKYPITLNISMLMNYQKQWSPQMFEQAKQNMLELTRNRIALNFFPLYTYDSLKNWWYEIVPTPFTQDQAKVVAKSYIDTNCMNFFPNCQIMAWAITRAEWQGSFSSAGQEYQELGYTYGNSNPIQITLAIEETDTSYYYPTVPAFVHYLCHELSHGFQKWGRTDNQDFTHQFDYQERNLQGAFDALDYQHLAINLIQ